MGPYNFWESMYSEKTMTILSIIDENEKGKELQKFIIIITNNAQVVASRS